MQPNNDSSSFYNTEALAENMWSLEKDCSFGELLVYFAYNIVTTYAI